MSATTRTAGDSAPDSGRRGADLHDHVVRALNDLPRLTTAVFAEVCERIALYRDDDIVPRDELFHSIDQNLRYLADALADPDVTPSQAAPAETGRRRAEQNAPLPEVLRVYHIACAMLWDFIAGRVRQSGGPGSLDVLVAASSRLWKVADQHGMVLTEAYRAETATILLRQQRRRSALVAGLFTGERVADARPWEVGRLLGLPIDADLVVVAAETVDVAHESLDRVEERLAEIGSVSAWLLTHTVQAGIVSLRDGGSLDELVAVLRRTATARTGISPPFRALDDTPRALHLARSALSGIEPGRAAVRVFSDSPLAALVAHDPDEAHRLASRVLGALLDLPAEDRSGLIATLEAYLAHDGSADRAAEALHCHPNTVRYRLRRVRELTGRSLSDPLELTELAVAVEAMRLQPLDDGSRTDARPPPEPA